MHSLVTNDISPVEPGFEDCEKFSKSPVDPDPPCPQLITALYRRGLLQEAAEEPETL